MADFTPADFLQPALFDRIVGSEGVDAAGAPITMPTLRGFIRRDLDIVLNTQSAPRRHPIWKYPRVARSVLNFGMPPLTGRARATMAANQIIELVRQTVAVNETRIVDRSLDVRIVEDKNPRDDEVSIGIRGEFCPLPAPEPLYVQAVLELDGGRFGVTEAGHG